ncbi:hypothetical protein [Halarcobacter anaerophilus]|uniref:hypothetical protein n=1 Tax=Halarcobacter anaerophilus TaxID=877500 RepID=UPI0005C951FB|nr:hypothetical protein [Halarcobacter anaerophilus]
MKINRLIKIVLLPVVLALALVTAASNYLHYKMKDEVIPYYLLVDELNTLNDTYALCSGLLLANPTQINIKNCNYINNKLNLKLEQIKRHCPHIYFYTKYIK